MLRQITKNIAGRTLMITMGLMLATAGLTASSAGSANAASSSVVSYWGTMSNHFEDDGSLYECGTTWDWIQNANPAFEIYNPCNTRVWVHYVNEGTGQVQAYCVNPGGGLAYSPLPITWSSSVTYSNIQLTSNTAQCDSGDDAYIWWNEEGTGYTPLSDYACTINYGTSKSGYLVNEAQNTCDSRLWLHANSNGTGNALCIDPGSPVANFGTVYLEFEISGNQMPCSYPAAPLPY
jgi:hypothetical protein